MTTTNGAQRSSSASSSDPSIKTSGKCRSLFGPHVAANDFLRVARTILSIESPFAILLAPGSEIPLPIEVREHDAEMAKEARRLFAKFMSDHDVPRATKTEAALSFDWLDDVPDGDAFVGSYGRIFDVIVSGRPALRRGLRPSMATIEAALFEAGRPVLLVAAGATPAAGREYSRRLELQHRAGENDSACDASPQTRQSRRRSHRAGRNRSGAER